MNTPPLSAGAFQQALRRCSAEPIQLVGAIQPYGALFALDDALVVRMASANLQRFFPLDAASAIGRPVADLVGEAQARRIAAAPVAGELRPSVPVALRVHRDGRDLHIAAQVHRSGGLLLVEIEPATIEGGDVFEQLFVPIRDALWRFDTVSDVGRYSAFIADEVRRLTGFDRVMVYRFDQKWDGEVIAESRNDALPSLIGHHFPASDIPPQARALYEKNLIRVLADCDAERVPLIPAQNPLTGTPLDMSFSVLRAMSPIHIEYLRNMGVRATITISLLQGRRLWGMIACHNAEPRRVPFHVRELGEFIGRTVSLKLSDMEGIARHRYMTQVRETLMMLTRMIREAGDIGEIIRLLETEILALVGATGSVIVIGNRRFLVGRTPEPAQLKRLTGWLKQRTNRNEVFYTDHLGEHLPEAAQFTSAAGVLAVALDTSFNDHILWFREEVVQSIPWAGNPNKQLVMGPDGRPRIEPRTSFALWVETARGRSRPWSTIETDAAHALSLSLIEVLTQKALRLSEENYRLLAEHSTDLISRHDREGRFIFVSPASRELLGHAPDALVGRSLLELLVPGEEPHVREAFAAVQTTREPRTIICRISGPQGTQRWLESTIKPVYAGSRDLPAEYVINSRDVTERHEYQIAVEQMQRRNTAILESAGEGVVGLDRSGRVTFANAAAAQSLGYERGQLIGLSGCRALYDREQPDAECRILAALRQGHVVQASDERFMRRDHTPFPVDYISTPMRADGEVDGAVIVFRDITQQRVMDERLRQSNTVFENTAEAIMMMDENGRITAVNRAFTEITGYGAEEVLGRSPNILNSGRHPKSFFRQMWRQVQLERSWRGEIWNRRKNGEVFPQWGSITAVVDESGRIRNYVTVFSDISKAKQTEAQLQFLAQHDPLTGLPNRHALGQRLEEAIARARERGLKLAVAFLDFDHFKVINDTFGHTMGDRFLQEVARRLARNVRDGDTLARWGGDEFVIALEQIASAGQVGDWAQRLVRAMEQTLAIAHREFLPSISVGIAVYPEDGADAERLVQAADSAMYRAKRLGRGRFEFFTEDLAEDAQHRFQMGWELRRALANDELVLHYQPQCDATSGRVVGLEALVRWQHPDRGLLPPYHFLPLVDELGLTAELGEWVLRTACRQLADWGKALPPQLRVAVNVAPVQLVPEFSATVARVLMETGVDAARLEIEITEGALERRDDVRRTLDAIRALGVSLSVDDFGTGYSSLAHLRDFPITCFKIDKLFVDGLPHSESNGAIVRTIVALASSLGVGLVAEGVEAEPQLGFLAQAGVRVIQGFLFSRPLPADNVLPFIESAQDGLHGLDFSH